MNGAQSLIGTLTRSGVNVCFTNPGTSEMHFVAALDNVPEMKSVLVLFEGVASGAADGYGRMMDKPAATLLHLGPGFANSMANMHNAKKARTPVVNIIGDHASYHQQYEAPLTTDVNAFASPVSHWVRSSPDAVSVGQDTADAVAAANTAPGQVASLLLPADTAWNEAEDYGTYTAPAAPEMPEDAAITKAADMLRNGKKTMVLANGKISRAPGLKALSRIADKTGALVYTDTFLARAEKGAGRAKVERLPYFAEQIAEVIEGVEQLITIGSQPPVSFFAYPDIPNYLTPDGCEVHELTTAAQDGTGALEALAEGLGCSPDTANVYTSAKTDLLSGDANPFAVWAALAHYMPENAIIVDEATTSGLGSETYMQNALPHDWLQLTGGSIGYGLPASVGAAIACPDRKVICPVGDGCAMYTIQALWTQAREGLDVTTIVFANRKYLILQIEIMRVGAENVGPKALDMLDISRPDIDFCKIAEGMGVNAMRAQNADDINRAMEHCMKNKGPHLIEVVI